MLIVLTFYRCDHSDKRLPFLRMGTFIDDLGVRSAAFDVADGDTNSIAYSSNMFLHVRGLWSHERMN